jgi:hypothetical protein
MASTLKVTEITTPDGTGNITVSRPLTGGTGVKGGDIASASPLVIDTDGDYFDVTGTTNFAAMTVAADRQFTLQFDGALTMTHHATNLDLPGEANITTAAGDVAVFQSTGANTVQCVAYTKADGTPVVSAGGGNKVVFLNTNSSTNDLNANCGDFRSHLLQNAENNYSRSNWTVPDDFSSMSSVKFVYGSDGTGNAYMAFVGAAAGDGEAYAADTDSIAITTYSTTASQMNYIDVTAAFNGLTYTADHVIGFECQRNAADANDTVEDVTRPIGWIIVYT